MTAKVRGILYILSIVAAFALAVLIAAGVIGKDQVLAVVALTLDLFLVFTSALARLNLTPDAP